MIVWRTLPFGGGVTISGTPELDETLHCEAPAGATFQWLRDGVPIAGATSADHVVTLADQGHNITCRAGIAGTPVMAIPAGSMILRIYGDSFANGSTDGLSVPGKRFTTQAAVLLGATELNYAHGGARNHLNTNNILPQVYQNLELPSAAPYAPPAGVRIVQASINNLNLDADHADLGIVTRSLARAIRRLRAAGTYEAFDGPMWSFTPDWFSGATTDANSGAGNQRTTTSGGKATLNVPADFPGGPLRIYGNRITGFGSVHTFKVDGVNHGTLDTRGGTATEGADVWEYIITGLAPGAHVIEDTLSSVATVDNINGADFEVAGQVPFVVVINTARAPAYPGSGEHAIVDADITASNAAVAAMLAAEFPGDPKIVAVDMDAVLAKNPASFGPDQIHPNDAGATLIAVAVADAIAAAVA